MTSFIISSISELKVPAMKVIELLDQNPVVCIDGEMGAGKTTFIKEICNQMGVKDATSSPTFSIVNEYLDRRNFSIYHFDFFRIKSLTEALDVGVEEYFYSGYPCFIEWSAMIKALIPEDHLEISIKLVDDNKREITINLPG